MDAPPSGPAAPQRILREVLGALARLPHVGAAALFGSLAEGRADAWSDIDLLVECSDAEGAPWATGAVLRAALPVRFYRPFSLVPQPSGRYWFAGESAFRLTRALLSTKRTMRHLRSRMMVSDSGSPSITTGLRSR